MRVAAENIVALKDLNEKSICVAQRYIQKHLKKGLQLTKFIAANTPVDLNLAFENDIFDIQCVNLSERFTEN